MIGAVVVAFRRPAALARAMDVLDVVDEVVVVNVTNDPRVTRVADVHGARLVPTAQNVGFGRAVNLGVAALDASVSHVLVLNDDVELRQLPSRDDTVWSEPVVVPVHLDSDGRSRSPTHPLPYPAPFVRWWILGRCGKTGSVPVAANGAATLVSRVLLQEVPFPEEYFLYWEEVAWYWRLNDRGVSPVLSSDFVIARPPGSNEFSDLKASLLGANLVRLGQERFGTRGTYGYFFLGVAWVLRLVLTDLASGDRKVRLQARRLTLSGLISGLFDPTIRRPG